MKNTDPGFADWWKPYQERFKTDPLMQFFNRTRNEVLKQGELATPNYTVIGAHGPVDMGAVMRELAAQAPPIAPELITKKRADGAWEVRMPDGSTEKVYVQLPAEVDIESGIQLSNPPDQHEGEPITDTSIANLGRLCIETLTRIVDEFVARFRQ